MKKNLLFLMALLCLFTTKGWAASESLLSYTVDKNSVVGEDITAGNGIIKFGAAKFETSDVCSSGYAFKSDNDVGSTKYALLKPSRALKAGDVIKLTVYASGGTPSGSDYGVGLYNARAATEAVKILYLTVGKNTLQTLQYIVTEGDGLAGNSEIYVFRAPGKSTYICGAEINSADDGGDNPGDNPGDEPGEVTYNANATYALAIDEAHNAGDVVSVKDADDEEIATITFGSTGEPAYKAAGKNGNITGFVAYTEGNGNSGVANGSSGTRYIIVPKYDGQIEVGVVLNKDKAFYVLEDGTPMSDYNGITVAEKYYGTYSFKVKAGKTYIVTCAGSKLGFYGFNYAYNKEGGTEPPTPVVTIAKPTFEVDGITYESGAKVQGLKTGQRVTINVEEGKYIYTNWSGKTGNAKADYYKADRMKGQTSYNASTSSGGQRVLYAVAGDTDDASGNSSDLAYIVFEGVVASNPTFTIEEGEVEAGITVGIKTICKDDSIYYTLDGSDPTTSSTRYTKAIEITETVTIKAIAYDKNKANPSEVVSVTYTVPVNGYPIKLNNRGLATFYDSQNAYTIPTGMTASYVESINNNKLSQVELNGIIPADCAVILEGTPGDYTLEPTDDAGTAPNNLLRGSDTAGLTTGEDEGVTYKFYALSAKNDVVGFYWMADGGAAFTNGAHKAYLAIPATDRNASNSAFILDGTDGIESIAAPTTNGPAYNLAGQRVGENYKGVVIVNGKKVMK